MKKNMKITKTNCEMVDCHCTYDFKNDHIRTGLASNDCKYINNNDFNAKA